MTEFGDINPPIHSCSILEFKIGGNVHRFRSTSIYGMLGGVRVALWTETRPRQKEVRL